MEDTFESGPFCKTVLSGLFAGITASVCCLVFDLLYCGYTGFPYTEMINISTIIFGINIVILSSGVLYYYMKKAFKLGSVLYIGIFILLTIYCLFKITSIQRSASYTESAEFRGLLSGITIISGLSCFFLIPFLNNNKAFNKHVI